MKNHRSAAKRESKHRFFDFLAKGTKALHNGEIPTATNYLEKAYRLDQEHVDAALNLGGAYILSKKFSQAVAILEPLSRRDPHNPMVWTNLGAAYLGNPVLASDEKQQQAIAAFKQALELNPATPNVAYNLGLIYLARAEHEQALEWFQQAVQANPNDRDAHNYIGQLMSRGE